MGKLKGKVAVVTGASKGIGAGIARALAGEGAAVIVNYATDRAGAERVVADIVARDGRAVAVQANTAKRQDVARLFAEAIAAFGAVHVLVNNAGVFKFDALETVSEEEFQREFDTNVLGPILTAQEAQKHFKNGGNIINISSVVSMNRLPNSVVYSATKSALDQVTRTLASTPSIRGPWRPRAPAPSACSAAAARWKKGWWPARRSVASVSPTTSHAWRRSWRRTTPRGSAVRSSRSRVAFAEAYRDVHGRAHAQLGRERQLAAVRLGESSGNREPEPATARVAGP